MWQGPSVGKDPKSTYAADVISYILGQQTSRFYKNLYAHLTKGEPLAVKVDEVRQQVAVIEEAHRQNPRIWGKG